MSQIREDMVGSAVTFLLDGSVADSPLAKKVEFLHDKGLTDVEVQEAIRRAQLGKGADTGSSITKLTSSPPLLPKDYPNYPLYYNNAPPLSAERDWKDYLIMVTATTGLAYGAYQVIRKYVVPKILPASKTELEKEKESIDQEFQRVQSLLDKFDEDQEEFYKKQNEKGDKIDETMVEIDKIINKNNEKNLQNEETLKFLKLEVDNIKTSLMKTMESQKQTIGSELSNLESQIDQLKLELKSLSTVERTRGTEFFDRSNSSTPAEKKVDDSKEDKEKRAGSVPASFSSLKIPPPSSIPSVNDVFKGETKSHSEIPAWQKAINGEDVSIPAWQMNDKTKE
ncbi:hypothetical protein FOA43_002764 [Brettanomyces nanus]|uniref:Peroxisomal membrane protein PEX14 n=1 Tax=Eeniella nana TaxID=13502 RepID=A0A875RPS7_EENNA|nr:uncharacterized protein FOA43_002764 [Brettanomyces nanus]QPG75410.1 hypothetical protein FOA43_002764 [Brettanomyces nanus]